MRIWSKILGPFLIFVSGVIFGFFFAPHTTYDESVIPVVSTQGESVPVGAFQNTISSSTIFLVGDIMLGRNVETQIELKGLSYPFLYSEELLRKTDLAVGNFEGVVSEPHTQTPSMTFRFSIKKEYLKQLKEVGFDVLSLANNHSFDYGAEAFKYTRTLCTEYELLCGGSSTILDQYTTHVVLVDDTKIGFVFLHTTWSELDSELLFRIFEDLEAKSDIQIVYVHWGEEYALVHNTQQETLARELIDRGADTIVGHHPHVIQDVEIYKNKLIFYSLGNFIFDQYFQKDVQEGLGVEMEILNDSIIYTLVPFTSEESRNQPRPMARTESQKLFERILAPLSNLESVSIESGKIKVSRKEIVN